MLPGSEPIPVFYLLVDNELRNCLKFRLHPKKRYTVEVVFRPYAVRAFKGELLFKFTRIQRRRLRRPLKRGRRRSYTASVFMHGYGGNSCVLFTLPDWDHLDNRLSFNLRLIPAQTSCVMGRPVAMQNMGNLAGFVYGRCETNVTPFFQNVRLEEFINVIGPHQDWCCYGIVKLIILEDMFKYFNDNEKVEFVDLGVLKIYVGAEVLRGRLRRLVNSVEESDCKTIPLEIVKQFTARFAWEQPFPEDIYEFLEPPCLIDQLLQEVVVITIPMIITRF